MKRNTIGRIAALLIVFALLFAGVAEATVLGTPIDSTEQEVLQTVELAKGVYWTGSDYRSENYIEYTPNESVFPIVVYGEKVCNYGKFGSMAALPEQQGLHVVAGINGDYYNTSDFQPLGIVVTDGILRSSDGGLYAVGFRADGTALIGKPALFFAVETPDFTFTNVTFNKTRVLNTLALFTEDYSYTTKNSLPGYDVILVPDEESTFTVDCTRTFTVEQVLESDGAINLEPGKVVLSLNAASEEWLVAILAALEPGDPVTVRVSSAPGWEDVRYAAGSLYKLVTNGQVEPGLEATAAPRTAVGVKPDGTLVLYTIDGRQLGLSIGASLTQVAQRLVEMGCTEATVMDGGGSTSINVVLPGDGTASQINSPSGGTQRSVTEYIMLVTTEQPTGRADRLALYPRGLYLLSGATAEVTAKAVDENGYPAAMPAGEQYTVSDGLGTVEGGLFRAEQAGSGSITVSANGVRDDSVPVTVIDTPDTIRVRNRGIAFSRLVLEIGQQVDLSATAEWNHLTLTSKDSCFTWSVEGDVGTITQEGVFTAADTKGSGTISVAAGDRTAIVAVEIIYPEGYWENPFDDVSEEDWYYEAVEFVCLKELFRGMTETEFAPDVPLTRAMVATLLYRLAKTPATDGMTNPFRDVAADAWYAQAVIWAANSGIVKGMSADTFAPDSPVTREQLVTMLDRWRIAQGGTAFAGNTAAVGGRFADWGSVSAWAEASMAWAVDAGILQGNENGAVLPGGSATRAQTAAIFQRYLDK